jgi:hypothetical protein
MRFGVRVDHQAHEVPHAARRPQKLVFRALGAARNSFVQDTKAIPFLAVWSGTASKSLTLGCAPDERVLASRDESCDDGVAASLRWRLLLQPEIRTRKDESVVIETDSLR